MKEFGDFVEEGLELVKGRDKNAWALGDLAEDFEVTMGRHNNPDTPKLADLANAWDVDTPRVSEWRNVAKFYPPKVRTYELSWSHYNLARRASDNDLENAIELLDHALMGAMGVRAFRRYLDGIYYEGSVKVTDLPTGLQVMVPSNVKMVWLTIKKAEADA